MVDPTAAALLGILVYLLEQIYTNVGSWYAVIALHCIKRIAPRVGVARDESAATLQPNTRVALKQW